METLCNNFIRYCGRLSGAKAHRIYFLRFVLCEILNLVNVVGQGCNSIDIFKRTAITSALTLALTLTHNQKMHP